MWDAKSWLKKKTLFVDWPLKLTYQATAVLFYSCCGNIDPRAIKSGAPYSNAFQADIVANGAVRVTKHRTSSEVGHGRGGDDFDAVSRDASVHGWPLIRATSYHPVGFSFLYERGTDARQLLGCGLFG